MLAMLDRQNSPIFFYFVGGLVSLLISRLKRNMPRFAFILGLIVRARVVSFYFKTFKIGRRAFLDKTVQILGWRNVEIGSKSIVSENCFLNINNKDKSGAQIVIGQRCYIGRRNFFTCGRRIEIGDYSMTGVECHFIGSNHLFHDPFSPYVSQPTTSTSIIRIGVNCSLGARVSVIGSVVIGHGSVVGANSLILDDIPPFSLVVGSPARIIKRFDMQSSLWVPVDQFTQEMESLYPTEEAYLGILKNSNRFVDLPLHAAGKSIGDLY